MLESRQLFCIVKYLCRAILSRNETFAKNVTPLCTWVSNWVTNKQVHRDQNVMFFFCPFLKMIFVSLVQLTLLVFLDNFNQGRKTGQNLAQFCQLFAKYVYTVQYTGFRIRAIFTRNPKSKKPWIQTVKIIRFLSS